MNEPEDIANDVASPPSSDFVTILESEDQNSLDFASIPTTPSLNSDAQRFKTGLVRSGGLSTRRKPQKRRVGAAKGIFASDEDSADVEDEYVDSEESPVQASSGRSDSPARAVRPDFQPDLVRRWSDKRPRNESQAAVSPLSFAADSSNGESVPSPLRRLRGEPPAVKSKPFARSGSLKVRGEVVTEPVVDNAFEGRPQSVRVKSSASRRDPLPGNFEQEPAKPLTDASIVQTVVPKAYEGIRAKENLVRNDALASPKSEKGLFENRQARGANGVSVMKQVAGSPSDGLQESSYSEKRNLTREEKRVLLMQRSESLSQKYEFLTSSEESQATATGPEAVSESDRQDKEASKSAAPAFLRELQVKHGVPAPRVPRPVSFPAASATPLPLNDAVARAQKLLTELSENQELAPAESAPQNLDATAPSRQHFSPVQSQPVHALRGDFRSTASDESASNDAKVIVPAKPSTRLSNRESSDNHRGSGTPPPLIPPKPAKYDARERAPSSGVHVPAPSFPSKVLMQASAEPSAPLRRTSGLDATRPMFYRPPEKVSATADGSSKSPLTVPQPSESKPNDPSVSEYIYRDYLPKTAVQSKNISAVNGDISISSTAPKSDLAPTAVYRPDSLREARHDVNSGSLECGPGIKDFATDSNRNHRSKLIDPSGSIRQAPDSCNSSATYVEDELQKSKRLLEQIKHADDAMLSIAQGADRTAVGGSDKGMKKDSVFDGNVHPVAHGVEARKVAEKEVQPVQTSSIGSSATPASRPSLPKPRPQSQFIGGAQKLDSKTGSATIATKNDSGRPVSSNAGSSEITDAPTWMRRLKERNSIKRDIPEDKNSVSNATGTSGNALPAWAMKARERAESSPGADSFAQINRENSAAGGESTGPISEKPLQVSNAQSKLRGTLSTSTQPNGETIDVPNGSAYHDGERGDAIGETKNGYQATFPRREGVEARMPVRGQKHSLARSDQVEEENVSDNLAIDERAARVSSGILSADSKLRLPNSPLSPSVSHGRFDDKDRYAPPAQESSNSLSSKIDSRVPPSTPKAEQLPSQRADARLQSWVRSASKFESRDPGLLQPSQGLAKSASVVTNPTVRKTSAGSIVRVNSVDAARLQVPQRVPPKPIPPLAGSSAPASLAPSLKLPAPDAQGFRGVLSGIDNTQSAYVGAPNREAGDDKGVRHLDGGRTPDDIANVQRRERPEVKPRPFSHAGGESWDVFASRRGGEPMAPLVEDVDSPLPGGLLNLKGKYEQKLAEKPTSAVPDWKRSILLKKQSSLGGDAPAAAERPVGLDAPSSRQDPAAASRQSAFDQGDASSAYTVKSSSLSGRKPAVAPGGESAKQHSNGSAYKPSVAVPAPGSTQAQYEWHQTPADIDSLLGGVESFV